MNNGTATRGDFNSPRDNLKRTPVVVLERVPSDIQRMRAPNARYRTSPTRARPAESHVNTQVGILVFSTSTRSICGRPTKDVGRCQRVRR